MDICSRYVPARAPGLHGGRDERSGSVPGVRPAPGHGAQNAGLLGSDRLPTKGCSPKPKLELFTVVIDAIPDGDGKVPRQQRHTAKLIFERLRDEYGLEGQYAIVKDYVGKQGGRPRKCLCRCRTCRATPSVISRKRWRSSAVWSARPTTSSWTDPTATVAS